MQYLIVEKSEASKMSETVEEMLNDGWKLEGNLVLAAYDTPSGEMTVYAQALTNNASEPDLENLATRITEFFQKPEDQLSPEERGRRKELAAILLTAKSRRDSDTGS